MDQQAFETGKAAYQRGDWSAAASALMAAKSQDEINGSVDHLLGNALMKMGLYDQAASAYGLALEDISYGKAGALACNRGRALLAAGRATEAVEALSAAASDKDYATPYKAYLALGNAHSALGDIRSAGVAYRNAAIDETNPDPARALTKLGGCFVQLGRPVDAVEAYRTALDFSTPTVDQDAIYAELGSAYVAANRMSEAVDAYSHAVGNGYQLNPTQQASYDAAQKAIAAIAGRGPSETDRFLQAAGYGSPSASGSYDPLDPTGKSGELIPSAEDTGFFTVTESDLMAADKKDSRKFERKHKHRGRKILIVILILILLVAGAAGFAYYKGYGWPTQQAVAEELFADRTAGDISPVLSSNVSDAAIEQITTDLPANASVEVLGIDRSMSSSTVLVSATLSDGGVQEYKISMVRDGLTWKVTAVTAVYPSQDGGEATLSSGSSTTTSSGSLDASTSTDSTSSDAA